MITHDFPLDKIVKAMDILQEYGVLSDNISDHDLAGWLQDNGLTADDLNNYEPQRATTKQQLRLAELVGLSFESDPADAYVVLASHFTNGFEADATKELIEEYATTMDLN